MAATAQVLVEWPPLGVLSGCLEVQAGTMSLTGARPQVIVVLAWWCRHGPYVLVLQDEGVKRRGKLFDVEIGEHVNNN